MHLLGSVLGPSETLLVGGGEILTADGRGWRGEGSTEREKTWDE
jgi:hypothetical protein